MKALNKVDKYFAKHVWYSHLVHVVGGMGIGVLIAYPIIGEHPVRWGIALLALAILGHLAPWFEK